MDHWQFYIAIKLGNGIHTFSGDSFTDHGTDPRELVEGTLAELFRKYPDLKAGRVIRCDCHRIR
ncbi:hypothetical protein [Streptomyces caatingaensis]|uniref:Uncharacterized protein n=1 Tax=Streptomyces caatingaensis TaxID=1678637 RepID=A0A0K9X9A6_9ACTN|nr:hypothetical protein [Streptomyces caatingaensis]KNB49217.1 hypothetical protein AC230_28305 [Streptomyces caatingaensis]